MHRYLVALLAACGSSAPNLPDLVVSPAWLADHASDVVLLHVGPDFEKKHIPGARPVALDDISVSVHDGTGLMLELPPAEVLRKRLEKLGISNDSLVVVYFANEWVSPATRVVFTLDAAGLGAHAALLDGGLEAWEKAGQPVGTAPAPTTMGTLAPFTLRPIMVAADEVRGSTGKAGLAVVDARDRPFYDGLKTGGSHGHPHRTGHIAGARSLPYTSVFDDANRLRSTDELAKLFAAAGVGPGDTVIGYCHVGQQATAMLFAARRLGHEVRLYDGSFEDWSLFHPSFPVETKATP